MSFSIFKKIATITSDWTKQVRKQGRKAARIGSTLFMMMLFLLLLLLVQLKQFTSISPVFSLGQLSSFTAAARAAAVAK